MSYMSHQANALLGGNLLYKLGCSHFMSMLLPQGIHITHRSVKYVS